MIIVQSRRARFTALALVTIALGLWIHRGGLALGSDARDIAGDALWAMMIAWWIDAVVPSARLVWRSAFALAICVAVELSQLLHTPTLDSIRDTSIGRLVLGSGFDPRDLLAYALGVGTAAALEWVVTRKRRHR